MARQIPSLAIVLAAGQGTRMAHPQLPKPLVEVSGRPMLQWVLDGLSQAECQLVVIVIGYRGHMIQDYFADAYRGMNIRYAVQRARLGTGDAIACASELIGDETESLLALADVLVVPNWYRTLTKEWVSRSGCDILMTVVQDNPSLGSLVDFDDQGKVTQITSRPAQIVKGWRDGGIGIFSRSALDSISAISSNRLDQKETRASSAMQRLLNEGMSIGAVVYGGPWCDLASPAAVLDAENRFRGLQSMGVWRN